MVKKSISEEDIEIEFQKLKEKNMSVQEKMNFIKENYLTDGCEEAKHLHPCGMLCTYAHGCSFKMHYQKQEEYCMKNW